MALNLNITIEGEEITLKHVERYSLTMQQEIKKITKEYAVKVRKEQQAAATIITRTGNLKKFVGYKMYNEGLTGMILPKKPKGAHRHLVAYGTDSRKNAKGTNRGTMPKNQTFAKAGEGPTKQWDEKLKGIIDTNETI